jgi:hypothetical protein
MSRLPDDKLEQKVPGTTKWNIREPPGTWMAWAVAELGRRLIETSPVRVERLRGGGNL